MIDYQQRYPQDKYLNLPCGKVAIGCALDYFRARVPFELNTRDDGYATLKEISVQINKIFDNHYRYYKRDERFALSELRGEGCAIVCVLGHFLFIDFDDVAYYSFFDNLDDKVVAVWNITGVKA